MTVPQQIVGLVERFEEQRESYRSGKYKEAQLRFLTGFGQFDAPITDHDKSALQPQIDTTDNHIDQPVYQLCGFSDDDIKTVEGRTR